MARSTFARAARAARVTLMVLAAAGALGGTLLVEGCGQQPSSFSNLDITGNTQFGKDFSLPDTSGKMRSLADFRGKVVVLFFGYTHCPDVCPTTMAELSQALQQLGPDAAKRVQVLFVSVDPERDPPPTVALYVHAFDPGFIGLTGDPQVIAALASDFAVAVNRVELPGGRQDAVAHRLGLQAPWVHAPAGVVVRIGRTARGRILGAEAVGLGGDDQPVHVLHAPSGIHELHRQPVE